MTADMSKHQRTQLIYNLIWSALIAHRRSQNANRDPVGHRLENAVMEAGSTLNPILVAPSQGRSTSPRRPHPSATSKMLETIPQLALLVTAIVSGYLLLRQTRSRKSLPLPPGPPSYPLIGQLLSVPQASEAQAFAEIGEKANSDIVSLNFFGVTIISLNSAEAAQDLLEKRPYIYSGRFCPPMIASPRLLDLPNFIAFMDSTELWKKQRRAMSVSLNQRAVLGFRAAQEIQTRKLLQRLLGSCIQLESSDELNEELHRVVGSILLDSVYGYELKTTQDQFLVDNMVLNHNLAHAILPSNFLVNVIPWMSYIPEWFPGAHWKKVAREWRDQKNRAIDGPYDWAKQRINQGADDYSVFASSLKDAQQSGFSQSEADEFSKIVGTAIFAGGMETSTSSALSFVLAMALYPEAQAKAQREIDLVVGAERLPTAEDRRNLPYTECLANEVLRWNPSTPIGVPHVCTQEDEFRGYRIPKGAITIGNIWAITRDERIYKDAETFNPDRFLDPAVPLPPVFGWGLRICPGQHFLREMFFIEVVSILAAFNISKFKDKDGQVVEPVRKPAENSASNRPASFKFTLSPRSRLHAELVRNSV